MTMMLPQGFPKFENYLAPFVADMRAIIFSSQVKAARYFNLTHTTVSRYESGQLTPPVGYIACLAQVLRDQAQSHDQGANDAEKTILEEVNKAIRWCYREKEPLQKPLRTWDELLALASTYLHEQRGTERPATSTAPAIEKPASLVLVTAAREAQSATINVSAYCNRCPDVDLVTRWVSVDRYRVVALLGIGGVGKTFLAAKIVEQVRNQFQTVIWRSLHDAPTVEALIADCLALCGDRNATPPASLEEGIATLVNALNQNRCLIVLDDFEAVLQESDTAGRYRAGYAGYGRLLRRIGETNHQSCLVLTSREKPHEIGLLEGSQEFARSQVVKGLEEQEALDILAGRGVFGTTQHQSELVQRYAGNPLALKIVTGTIRDVFGGDVSEFLRQGEYIYGDIAELLTEQFNRLTDLEQALLYRIADTPGHVALTELLQSGATAVPRKKVLEAIESLHNRSLLERCATHAAFTMQPLVMAYVSERLHAIREESMPSGSETKSQAERILAPILTQVLN